MIRFIRRAIHFGLAWARWKLRGSPKRTPETVAMIWNKWCQNCVHYHPDLEECTICECYVRESAIVQNKILYATERCPLGYWR